MLKQLVLRHIDLIRAVLAQDFYILIEILADQYRTNLMAQFIRKLTTFAQ
jgi:hypothetical protein